MTLEIPFKHKEDSQIRPHCWYRYCMVCKLIPPDTRVKRGNRHLESSSSKLDGYNLTPVSYPQLELLPWSQRVAQHDARRAVLEVHPYVNENTSSILLR